MSTAMLLPGGHALDFPLLSAHVGALLRGLGLDVRVRTDTEAACREVHRLDLLVANLLGMEHADRPICRAPRRLGDLAGDALRCLGLGGERRGGPGCTRRRSVSPTALKPCIPPLYAFQDHVSQLILDIGRHVGASATSKG